MATTEQAVKFGLKNAYYALYDDTSGKYGTPKRLNGAVSLSISREGDESTFYADDIAYYSTNSNAGYSGELEIATLKDDMRIDLLGQQTDANGVLLESTDDVPPTFALLYEVSGNINNQRFAFYNCTLSRPETEANTKEDTVEPDTDTLEIRMISRAFTYGTDTLNLVKGSVLNTTETADTYNDWFNKVYEPTKASA